MPIKPLGIIVVNTLSGLIGNGSTEIAGKIVSLILGIDAAWTEKGTSGVALLECVGEEKRVIAVSSSYKSFISKELASSGSGAPDISALLRTAGGKDKIDVVAIDMPMARTDIKGRREADQAVSRKFGAYKAAVHSPNESRPGKLGKMITEGFESAGFHLVTNSEPLPPAPFILEVYPLAALVRLLGRRPEYKAGKTNRYWRGRSLDERIDLLLVSWRMIVESLKCEISEIGFQVPERSSVNTLAALKSYEDMLDAVISAWVGALFLKGEAEPFGDETAAIWIPKLRQENSMPLQF